MKIEKYKQVWALWADYQDALKKYVFRYTQNEEFTKDIVQDTLLKIHNSCCSDKEIKNIRSWLFQIAHNVMIDFFKKSDKISSEIEHQIIDGKDDIYKELSIYIEPLIGFLPEKYAIPLKMADIEGLKQQKIANKLGLSLTGAKSRIQRARKLLKEEIHTCFYTKECSNAGLTYFSLKQDCTPLKNLKEENK